MANAKKSRNSENPVAKNDLWGAEKWNILPQKRTALVMVKKV